MVIFQILGGVLVKFSPGTGNVTRLGFGAKPGFVLIFGMTEAAPGTVIVGFTAVGAFLNDDTVQEFLTGLASAVRIAEVSVEKIPFPIGD